MKYLVAIVLVLFTFSCTPEPNPCDVKIDTYFVHTFYRKHYISGSPEYPINHFTGVRTDTFFMGQISICDTSSCPKLTIAATDYDSLFYLELFPDTCFWRYVK